MIKLNVAGWFIVIYSILTTVTLIACAISVLLKGNEYAFKFKKNITYADNVLLNHIQTVKATVVTYNKNMQDLQKQILNLKIRVSGINSSWDYGNEQYLKDNCKEDTLELDPSPLTNLYDYDEYKLRKNLDYEPRFNIKEDTIQTVQNIVDADIYTQIVNNTFTFDEMNREFKKVDNDDLL